MYNEVCILLISYMLCVFTDFVPSTYWQYNIGWVVVLITTLNLASNSVIIIGISVKILKNFIVRKCKKRADPKVKKYLKPSKLDHTDLQLESLYEEEEARPYD
mmetsp:Transcript_23308/g.22917  ORF Transcript_23308/g.22917 Transcript_23308/m.22917 type:complete len:103 (+) Transcript_23308:4177-4485(+)